MPKKKSPSVLYLSDKDLLQGKMITMNRAARKAYPNNQTQKLWPLRKDRLGNYYREDQDAIRKANQRVQAQDRRREESLRREREAAKALRRAQAANQGNAKERGVSADPVGGVHAPQGDDGCTEENTSFQCADSDG